MAVAIISGQCNLEQCPYLKLPDRQVFIEFESTWSTTRPEMLHSAQYYGFQPQTWQLR